LSKSFESKSIAPASTMLWHYITEIIPLNKNLQDPLLPSKCADAAWWHVSQLHMIDIPSHLTKKH